MMSNSVTLDSGLLHGSRKTHTSSTLPKRITALVAGGCVCFLAVKNALMYTGPWTRTAVSSSPTDLASVSSGNENCHPLHGQTFKIWVSGYDNGKLNKWLSFNDDGHWLIARYSGKNDAFPVLFHAASECNSYHLQNKWNNDDRWISVTSCGTWLRATYTLSGAMPMKFIPNNADGTYKLQNVYPGTGDLNQQYLSFTTSVFSSCGGLHPQGSLRATYGAGDAMKVTLHDPGPLSVAPCFETTSCYPLFPASSSSAAGCHPLRDKWFKIWVSGLGKWLSSTEDGQQLTADNDDKGSAMHLYFMGAFNQCDAYYVRNIDEPFGWFNFDNCGTWLRAESSQFMGNAMAVKFTDSGDGTYKMQNVEHGSGDFNQQYVSFTSSAFSSCGGEHPLRSLRANYGVDEAMNVTLHDPGPLSVPPCFETTGCLPSVNSSVTDF